MKANKKFAALYDQAKEAELRLVVVLVPDSVAEGDEITFNEFGAEPAGPDLDAALSKVEAFLALPSVQAITEALGEQRVYVGQLEGLSRQADDVVARLTGVGVSIARFEEDALREAASITGTSK